LEYRNHAKPSEIVVYQAASHAITGPTNQSSAMKEKAKY